MEPTQPLAGRVALVTGVSRRIGIGFAVVRRLLEDGASVLATGHPAHDAEMPWGADPTEGSPIGALAETAGAGSAVAWTEADLADPEVPERLVRECIERFGSIDIVVANHARSSGEGLAEVTAADLDRCFAVNARASVLLAQALGKLRPEGAGGRLILFTSGQHRGPMDGEIAYAVSKGAIHQMTASLANALAESGITVNCINPGPVDTGYATGARHEQVRKRFPSGRWGEPNDVARLVAWLACDESAWLTAQVIDQEGGFRRG